MPPNAVFTLFARSALHGHVTVVPDLLPVVSGVSDGGHEGLPGVVDGCFLVLPCREVSFKGVIRPNMYDVTVPQQGTKYRAPVYRDTMLAPLVPQKHRVSQPRDHRMVPGDIRVVNDDVAVGVAAHEADVSVSEAVFLYGQILKSQLQLEHASPQIMLMYQAWTSCNVHAFMGRRPARQGGAEGQNARVMSKA